MWTYLEYINGQDIVGFTLGVLASILAMSLLIVCSHELWEKLKNSRYNVGKVIYNIIHFIWLSLKWLLIVALGIGFFCWVGSLSTVGFLLLIIIAILLDKE